MGDRVHHVRILQTLLARSQVYIRRRIRITANQKWFAKMPGTRGGQKDHFIQKEMVHVIFILHAFCIKWHQLANVCADRYDSNQRVSSNAVNLFMKK